MATGRGFRLQNRSSFQHWLSGKTTSMNSSSRSTSLKPGAEAAPRLRMRHISKRFPGITALDSVDLDAFPSEVVALIGENGAGKSTLMNILGGIHRPDAGVIEIDGSPAAIRSVR